MTTGALNPLVVGIEAGEILIKSDDLSLVGTTQTINFSTFLVDYPSSAGPNYIISIDMEEELPEVSDDIVEVILAKRQDPSFSIADVNPTYLIDLAANGTTFQANLGTLDYEIVFEKNFLALEITQDKNAPYISLENQKGSYWLLCDKEKASVGKYKIVLTWVETNSDQSKNTGELVIQV